MQVHFSEVSLRRTLSSVPYQKLYFVIQLAESIIDDTWVCHITFSA